MPEIASIKIIFTVFAIFAWSRAFIRFQKRLMNIKELIFWSILWGGLTVLVFIPGKTDFLARLLGMKRGIDAMFFFGIIVLFYAVYRLYAKANNLEYELTQLVRKIAIQNTEKNNQPKA